MTTPRKRTVTTVIEARCLRCDFHADKANAQAVAAIHHDTTGHAVSVAIERTVVYGDPSAATPGQEALAI